MKPSSIKSLIVAALLGLGTTAHANLVTNGGFETGDLTGWAEAGADFAGADTDFAHTGQFAFRGFDNDGFATLSQTIATVNGTTYDLSFWTAVHDFIHAGNILRYQVDAGPIGTVIQSLSYVQTTTSFVAAGASTTIQFYIETDGGTGTWLLDDVSVEAGSSVPDSSSLIVFAIAALGLAGFRKTARVRSA